MNKISEIKKTIRYVCKKNILVIIMIILLCPVLAASYSSFIKNTGTFRASEMFIGNLLYSLKIDGTSRNTITVPKGETEAVIEITSLNTVSSNYKLVYAINPNINVIYAVDENEPTYGLITNTKTSSVLIMNTSENNITITFDIAGGFITDELANVTADTGYTEVSSNYMKYDYETLAMFVDGVRVSELDANKAYNLLSYSCTNDEIVKWSNADHSLKVIDANVPTKCRLYFEETVWEVYTSYSCANVESGNEPFTLTYTGNCSLEIEENDNWKIKLLTSGTLLLAKSNVVDAFMVGGGGSGGPGNNSGSTTSRAGGGGGGGGYTRLESNLILQKNIRYDIEIGTGSTGSERGEETNINKILNAYGGYSGGSAGAGNGGSGGGWDITLGGSDGGSAGGYGQGTTTREFHEITGILYAGGGGSGGGAYKTSGLGGDGGGGDGQGSSGFRTAIGEMNKGGGGGGAAWNNTNRYAGGDGIIVLRNARGTSISNAEVKTLDKLYTYSGLSTIYVDTNKNWKIKFFTNGIFVPYDDMSIDIFVVGGGGSGGPGNNSSSTNSRAGGGGGGGGYTNLLLNASLTGGSEYQVVIGEGGVSFNEGGTSSFADLLSASGGLPGKNKGAGNGGSGGAWNVELGGSDGGSAGGNGQGTTTREFHEVTGELYAGGGGSGGGAYLTTGLGGNGGGGDGQNATGYDSFEGFANTGGGGGGSAWNNTSYYAGGSGVVIIRNAR